MRAWFSQAKSEMLMINQTELPAYLKGKLLTAAEYRDIVEKLFDLLVCMIKLYSHARGRNSLRQKIIASLLARCAVSSKGILALYQQEDYASCMILLRSIVDRVFYLGFLERNDAYKAYYEKTIRERHAQFQRIKSDPIFGHRDEKDLEVTFSISKRLSEATGREHTKKMPPYHTQDEAKHMGLGFLYTFAYQTGSSFVHPMADEGFEDLQRLVGIPGKNLGSPKEAILQNVCLSMLVLAKYCAQYSDPLSGAAYLEAISLLTIYTGTGNRTCYEGYLSLLNKIAHTRTEK